MAYSSSTRGLNVGTSSSMGAKLGVKGGGSGSGTTTFLLRNGSDVDLFKVTDDGVVTIPYRLGIGRTPSNSLDVGNATINVIRNDYINTVNNAYTVARTNISNGNISFWQK